ncbi:hypothetical protein HK098_005962 [Nowakowskiella sp. JEL0407]|nr:hypothetical protein HK098_005962 [Nowakowskiella sp. JEL0407]
MDSILNLSFPERSKLRYPDLILRSVLDDGDFMLNFNCVMRRIFESWIGREVVMVNKVVLDYLSKKVLELVKKVRSDFIRKHGSGDEVILLGYKDGWFCLYCAE